MKRIVLNTLAGIAVCLAVAQAMAAEKKAKNANDDRVIKQLEQEWAEALQKRDQAAIDRIVARDWMLTDPEGALITKGQADADLNPEIGRGLRRRALWGSPQYSATAGESCATARSIPPGCRSSRRSECPRQR